MPDGTDGPAENVNAARRSMSTTVLLATLAGLVVFLAVRLGPALIGVRTFSGVDLLTLRAPWDTGTSSSLSVIPYITDSLDEIFPAYLQMHSRLFAGDLAWWSGIGGSGTELLAVPGNPTLTPTSIWMLLLPTSWSLGFTKLLQVVVAFGGMTLWLRRLDLTWAAGAVAGLLYVGSGFVTAWANWSGQSTVACTVPALFWVIERFLQRRTARSALPIAAVVAFLLLGGFPAVAGHAMYVAGCYFLVRLFFHRRGYSAANSLATLGGGVLALGLGVGLSAIQLLPQFKNVQGTGLAARHAEFNAEQPVQSFLSLFYPRTFNAAGYAPSSNPIEAYAYVGFAALMLAGLALLAWRWNQIGTGILVLLTMTLLLAAALVWHHGFWTDWLSNVPVFDGNNSGRLRDMVALAGCALAGIGFNLMFRRDLPAAIRRRLIVGAWVMVVGACVLTVVVAVRYRPVISRWLLLQDAGLGVATMVLLAAGLTFLLPAAVAPASTPAGTTAGTTARATPATRGGRPSLLTGALVAVVALLAVQAGNSVSYFWPLSQPVNFYPRTAAIDAAAAQVGEGRAVTLGTFLGSTASAYGIRTVTAHNFSPTPWADLVNSIDPAAYTSIGQSVTNPAIGLPLTNPRLWTGGKLLDRLAVNTIIAAPSMQLPGPRGSLTGKSVPAAAPAGVERITMGTGSSATFPLTAQNLRGVQVQLLTPIREAGSSISLTATITAQSGKVLAVGQVTRRAYAAGFIPIPIAAETLGSVAGPLDLKIAVSQPSGEPRSVVLAGAGGKITVSVISSADDGLTETYADQSATVWSRASALPRIRWATANVVLPSAQAQLATLAAATTPDTTVVLSKPGPVPSGRGATLTTTQDTGDRVVVDVHAKGSGYLVLADDIQAGWKVTVNGAAGQIQDADHAFGAVFVPSGDSVVVFGYVGQGLKAGIVISTVSLLVALGVITVSTVFRRRRIVKG